MYILQRNYPQFRETTSDFKNVIFLLIYNYTGGQWWEKKVSTEAFCHLPYFLGN